MEREIRQAVQFGVVHANQPWTIYGPRSPTPLNATRADRSMLQHVIVAARIAIVPPACLDTLAGRRAADRFGVRDQPAHKQ
ncbi:hypothetical protein [Lysobacter gummosus]|uniref:hypothetical protein n=1 Tax=Lysobacter gummosus TaxID=262324 RepID=UPI003630AF6B